MQFYIFKLIVQTPFGTQSVCFKRSVSQRNELVENKQRSVPMFNEGAFNLEDMDENFFGIYPLV